jgi:hypothetical protein
MKTKVIKAVPFKLRAEWSGVEQMLSDPSARDPSAESLGFVDDEHALAAFF